MTPQVVPLGLTYINPEGIKFEYLVIGWTDILQHVAERYPIVVYLGSTSEHSGAFTFTPSLVKPGGSMRFKPRT